MVFKMAAEIISVVWRLFKCNISHQHLQLSSEKDGHIGCQYKERQTGKRSNYSPSYYMVAM